MKRFDPESIKQRLLKNMKVKTEWAQILDNGVVSNLLDVYAEGEAELARYMEYLLGEKKWATARNMTSLMAMSKLISHKKRRPISAAGFIVVSHTDEQGADRLSNYGKTFFDLNDPSNYDEKVLADSYTTSESQALVPWTNSKIYVIPKGTVFTANNGVKFLSTKNTFSRFLSSPYSYIANDPERLAAFKAAGGWDGIKYVKVPVIQGIEREVSIGRSKGEKFESFVLEANDVEDASNAMTEDFFYVTVTSNDGTTTEKWIEVPNIRLANPYDKVFETELTDDERGIIFKFGDGVSGQMLTEGNIVSVHYLETLGSKGNIENKYQITSMTFPKNVTMVDPRTNTASSFLSCINTVALLGGKDAETEEDFKDNAPTSYVKSYATATKSEYEEKIKKYSPVSLLHLRVFPESSFETNILDVTVNDLFAEVANEYTTIKNTLKITAISSNGEKIEDPEATFIEPILESLSNIKGPNDSFEFCEPNFIKMAAGVVINTDSTQYSDEEIKDFVKDAYLNKYSIFNTDFKMPLYKSALVSAAKGFPFSNSVSLDLEAVANVNYSGLKIINYKRMLKSKLTQDDVLVAIPFNFDTIYSQNAYQQGFKNYTLNSGYLLKVNISFNSTAKSVLNRTLFLLDNRLDSESVPTLQEAKALPIVSTNQTPPITLQIIDSASNITTQLYDETSQFYTNRQVRVAQFAYINEVTNESFITAALDPSKNPYENRPYIQDNDGLNRSFATEDVPQNLRAFLTGDTSSAVCYKINTDYIENVDILFTENYNNVHSTEYASGHIILPLSYFSFNANKFDFTSDIVEESIATAIESTVKINVMAKPKMEDFNPQNDNDIIFLDPDLISVEKNFLVNK